MSSLLSALLPHRGEVLSRQLEYAKLELALTEGAKIAS